MRTAFLSAIVTISVIIAVMAITFFVDIAPPVETMATHRDRAPKRCRAPADRLPLPANGAAILEHLSIDLPRDPDPRQRWP